MLAFSIWNAIWLVFVTTLFIGALLILFNVVVDLFRDQELSGVAKALWAVFLILLPLLGTLIYLVVRGEGMSRRELERRQSEKAAFDDYVASVAGSGGPASELERAAAMHKDGSISDEEYAALKSKIIG